MKFTQPLVSSLIILSLGVTGCTSVPSDYSRLLEAESYQPYSEMAQQDVLNRFGEPTRVVLLPEGGEHFFYGISQQQATHWSNYIPVKAFLFGFDTVETHVVAEFVFDKSGMLVSTEVNETQIENDYGIGNRRFYPSNW
ncbi:hypothetical protein [Motilimonas pumila]|uniref:Uncharacterized protein n=1 Tax=Motilimonas pumila TaxID=2303987 RepID=A0A418YIS8_9GAMM|nr:hypothetical protein [Motilimonas pumila]RJG50519.1 hypothetical protein D1Z90_03295 [Motilimonas pumila]